MTLSLYEASVPILQPGLINLENILKKGLRHCRDHNIDESILTGYRLYPDMYTLDKQAQTAVDMVKILATHLAGMDPPQIKDRKPTFEALLARVDAVRQLLAKIDAEQINASSSRPTCFELNNYELTFPSGESCLQKFILPNFYFHSSMVYAILRHNGVKLSKIDFLGNFCDAITPLSHSS
jgi:hypothetical protein